MLGGHKESNPLRLLFNERSNALTIACAPFPARDVRVRAGEMLTTEHTRQKQLYLVMEGELQVAKHGIQIATVGAGEFAGEVT